MDSKVATVVSGRGPGLYRWNEETKTFSKVAGSYLYPGVTHQGLHTRIRLASGQQPEMGRWERTDQLNGYYIKAQIKQVLPPECIAPGHRKMRSHRKGLSIYTIAEAVEREREHPWKANEAHLRALLDMPTEEIEALANMKRLTRLASIGGG